MGSSLVSRLRLSGPLALRPVSTPRRPRAVLATRAYAYADAPILLLDIFYLFSPPIAGSARPRPLCGGPCSSSRDPRASRAGGWWLAHSPTTSLADPAVPGNSHFLWQSLPDTRQACGTYSASSSLYFLRPCWRAPSRCSNSVLVARRIIQIAASIAASTSRALVELYLPF
eukprot:scaffold130950_cov29-Tisochrysis_lutea.AAC.1